MCGRATLSSPPELLKELFKLEHIPLLNARYNMAPSQDLPIIREPHKLELLSWGLQNVGHARGLNVRAETVARAPQYRDSFSSRRCLVVVDGFFEWKRTTGKKKQPYLIHRADGRPFALAGIWEAEACAVITGVAQGVVAELHNRMPIIIAPDAYDRWLDLQVRPLDLLKPDAGDLVARPVSDIVNSALVDDPRCVQPVDAPAAPAGLPEQLRFGHN
jgi:putative SOS response-associated peptidase YedK